MRVLVDAHKYDYNDKDGYDKSIKILTKALDLVEQEKQRRKNKWDKLAYIQAMLKFEFAEISRDGVLNGKFNDQDLIIRQKLSKKMFTLNSIHPLLFKKLSAVCEVRRKASIHDSNFLILFRFFFVIRCIKTVLNNFFRIITSAKRFKSSNRTLVCWKRSRMTATT